MLLLSLAFATEPGGLSPDGLGGLPSHPGDTFVVPWTELPIDPGGPEAAPRGPDALALGPDGRWVVWDPVGQRLYGAGVDLTLPAPDGLAFAPDGDLLVLSGRVLTRWEGDQRLAAWAVPGLVPVGATLQVWDEVAVGVDLFGNAHPIADVGGEGLDAAADRSLAAPLHFARVREGVVWVDGARVTAPADTLGARVLGEWLVVEAGQRGAVRARQAIALDTGRVVDLPVRSRAAYRAAFDVAVGPDGTIGWLDPQADGLHIRREAP